MGTIEALGKIIGKRQVLKDGSTISAFGQDASPVAGTPPLCVVRPKDTDQVQQLVRLANREGFKLVPVSSSGGHTRGDTVPRADNCVVVDLSGMDQVLRIDRRNKVAMIQPGVAFETLQRVTVQEGLRLATPLAPRGGKSVLGSLLEREPTLLPKYHWDMSDPLCCLEVIFGEGSLFRTGSAAGPGTLEEQWASGQAQKSPMGPSQTDWAKLIQGAQGTLGVVTWASVKLELLPSVERAFVLASADPGSLTAFTYAILRRRMPDVCLLLNRVNLAALLQEHTPADLPPWVVLYSLSGYEHLPQERLDYLAGDIAQIASEGGLRPGRHLAGLPAERPLKAVTQCGGEPSWKKRPAGGYQDIVFLTTLDRAPTFIAAMQALATKQGLPPERLGVYLQPVNQGRACHVEFTLFYDPEDTAETQAMWVLFDAAAREMISRGGFFSRPYGPWAGLAYERCPDTVRALHKVKGILDPNGVMNPGRLCFT